jgi:hypothetical protein
MFVPAQKRPFEAEEMNDHSVRTAVIRGAGMLQQ